MKNKIKYSHSIVLQYDDFSDVTKINIDKINEYVSKILDALLSFDEVYKNACFFNLKFKTLSFDIIFINDDEIHKINKEYRQKDRPTDVITFALFADDDFKMIFEDEINLGEILISLDTAKRQAEDGNRELETEILTLITHGILHLFGFDHQTEEDYNFIIKVQDDVLNVILP